MDKQREIYRQLLVQLFEKNFTSALFVEKTDTMMKICDFESIRNEIEEETFTKNHGIKPYIDAIKYLCKKIEKCTADNTLFAPIEDYICAKEKIMVTKIAKVAQTVPAKVEPAKSKKRKGTTTTETETTLGHAECISPNTCKKCRFMRRLDRPKSKTTKRGKKTALQTPAKKEVPNIVQEVKTEVMAEIKTEVKTEVDYPNYMESIESVINASKNVMKSKPVPAQTATSNQLPYHDHQYSRITFYGSGMNTSETKAQENSVKKEEEEEEVKQPTQLKLKIPKRLIDKAQNVKTTTKPSQKSEKKPRQKSEKKPPRKSHQVICPMPIVYHFKPNNGLQQPTPAYFVPSIPSTSSALTASQYTPPVVRTIHKPLPSNYVHAPVPLHFRAPVTFVQGPVIQQPIYYLLCNPKK